METKERIDMAPKYRRLNYFVLPKLQLKFAGWLLVIVFGISVFTALTIYYSIWMLLGEKLAAVYPQGRLVQILNSANLTLFLRMLIITPVLVAVAIYLSHRIAGPIFNINRSLGEVARGNFSLRIRLRKTDELQDVASNINKVLDVLEEKSKK